MKARFLCVAALIGSIAVGAYAQDAARAPVLAGPSVPKAPRTTLVERESDGTIRRTEVPPEIAALELLELHADVRARLDRVLHERGRFLERFIEGNLELLSKLDTASNTGDKADQARLGLEALVKLAPLTRQGSLRRQVREVLPAGALDRFDAILQEYWDAIITQEKQRDDAKSRFEIMTGERAASFLREVTAAYERLEKSGTLLFRYFFEKVELSPEQEAEIRAVLDEFVETTQGSPTKAQERDVFFAVMSRLDTKQQTALIRHFKAREKPVPEKNERVREPRGGAPSPAPSGR